MKDDQTVIKPMKMEHFTQVFKLGEKVFDNWDNLYRTWEECEILERFIADSQFCLVAETNGQLSGFIIGTTVEKNHSAWKYGYIVWLGIDPQFTGTGIGSKLFKKITSLFVKEGVRMLIADTAADNEKAIKFFKKHGFDKDLPHIYLTKNLTK